jgi:hypothetical protein
MSEKPWSMILQGLNYNEQKIGYCDIGRKISYSLDHRTLEGV